MRPFRLALVALVALVPRTAEAQRSRDWFDQARSFSVYEENDAFTDTDDRYTQGLRATWEFSAWNEHWNTSFRVASLAFLLPGGIFGTRDTIRGECLPRSVRYDQPCGTVRFGIGQTIFTPHDIIRPEMQPNDRPYAGWLFGSFGWGAMYAPSRMDSTRIFSSVQLSTELIVGVTGPKSFARNTQSLAHWTWSAGSGQPQGWDNQLGTMVHANLVSSWAARPKYFELCGWGGWGRSCTGEFDEKRWLDLTPRTEIALGTLMTRVSGGGMLRAGWRFPDVLGTQRIPIQRGIAPSGTSGEKWWDFWRTGWAMAFATYDARLVGHNALISGFPGVDDGDGEWRDVSRIETRRTTQEHGVGVAAGFRRATLMAQLVWRTAEYKPNDDTHRFGTVTLSLHQ